jgi:hypothetical protein
MRYGSKHKNSCAKKAGSKNELRTHALVFPLSVVDQFRATQIQRNSNSAQLNSAQLDSAQLNSALGGFAESNFHEAGGHVVKGFLLVFIITGEFLLEGF